MTASSNSMSGRREHRRDRDRHARVRARGSNSAGVEVTRVVDDGRRHTEALTGALGRYSKRSS